MRYLRPGNSVKLLLLAFAYFSFTPRSDVAYYDALGETILCVGLIRPKTGVFKSFIRYLLILATTIDIVILGVTFSSTADGRRSIH